MKEIQGHAIVDAVSQLCIAANTILPKDITSSINQAISEESWQPAKDILSKIYKNIDIAKDEKLPLCQDTGMACVFLELGQDVHIVGMDLYTAINEGVRRGYMQGYLRKSVVSDPLKRINTNDNTPALINTEIVAGDNLKITVAPKGFGSENMSRIKMFSPHNNVEDIKDFVVETIKLAGSNPCPPIIIGVGIGGNFEKVALLSKKAMLRNLKIPNADTYYANLESELLTLVNQTGIGPQGFGGKTTALKVNIETYPTHISGLPVAVNIGCHVTRHKSIIL